MSSVGEKMYEWAKDLFPICRSLTGDGVRETLNYLKGILPDLKINEVPSGTIAFDWTVPDEWNIKDAFVANEKGERIIDINENNLHIVGYSEPVDECMTFDELDEHLYSLPDMPDAIPYVTSYYQRRWGFCLTENKRKEMKKNLKSKYHVKIDSTLEPGSLTYGELIIPGKTEKEILLSTYVCHPSIANNELSGPCVAVALAQWIQNELKDRKHTFRVLFLVETIGAIVYLSKHLEEMKKNTVAGFILTCLGDNRTYSYLASRKRNTLADRIALHVLKHHAQEFKSYSFLERGSDERQYCSPGIDLPVVSLMRSKYAEYPEYHTSKDDMSLISSLGLEGGYAILKRCIECIEINDTLKATVLCEPQLGKRGLYPTISTRDSGLKVRNMMNLIAYCDGNNSLLDIAEIINIPLWELSPIIKTLSAEGLIEKMDK